MFHGVLLCSMSKTLHRRQKTPLLSAQSVCDAGIVHLHHTEPLTEQMGEEDVESSENVKKTWSRLLQLGISCCRGCTPICTCNLHQSELQPNKHLKVVGEVGATGLVSCRAAGRFFWFFFRWDLRQQPDQCGVEGSWPRVCVSDRVKQVCSVLCLTRPPASPFTLFWHHFFPKTLLVQRGRGNLTFL